MIDTMVMPTSEREAVLSDLLEGIVVQCGGAVEFWTLVCLSRRQLGDPTLFVDRQWMSLREQIQELRERLQDGENELSEPVLEQIAKLLKASAELREVFDFFINADSVAQKDLEAATMKLAQIWRDMRMRVWLLGTLIPLPEPPTLSMEKEAYLPVGPRRTVRPVHGGAPFVGQPCYGTQRETPLNALAATCIAFHRSYRPYRFYEMHAKERNDKCCKSERLYCCSSFSRRFRPAPRNCPRSRSTKTFLIARSATIKNCRWTSPCRKGRGPFPAVVCVHGGAWRFGKRQDMSAWIRRLAEEGYVAAAVSYRLLPEAKFPEPIVDCATAVRFLRANAEKYRIDKGRIGALGYSAGGHLVSLLGVAGKVDSFQGKEYADQSSKVQAVVSYFGPTDLTYFGSDESAQNSTFVPLLGGRFKDKPESYKNASPITYVTKDAPPFLFLHGTKDWLVPIEQSRTMCKKLKDAGVSAEIVEVEGGSHGFDEAESRKTTRATLKFLAEKLKK